MRAHRRSEKLRGAIELDKKEANTETVLQSADALVAEAHYFLVLKMVT